MVKRLQYIAHKVSPTLNNDGPYAAEFMLENIRALGYDTGALESGVKHQLKYDRKHKKSVARP